MTWENGGDGPDGGGGFGVDGRDAVSGSSGCARGSGWSGEADDRDEDAEHDQDAPEAGLDAAVERPESRSGAGHCQRVSQSRGGWWWSPPGLLVFSRLVQSMSGWERLKKKQWGRWGGFSCLACRHAARASAGVRTGDLKAGRRPFGELSGELSGEPGRGGGVVAGAGVPGLGPGAGDG